jgi:hypothetical protein
MRSLFIIVSCLTLCIVSCRKSKTPSSFPHGTYKGTFLRTAGDLVAPVTLSFSSGNWSGESAWSTYPALCHGKYKALGTDSINFENRCVWTANFDWTLILHGNYKLVQQGDSLIISKEYNGHYMDIYNLKKQ